MRLNNRAFFQKKEYNCFKMIFKPEMSGYYERRCETVFEAFYRLVAGA